MILSNIDIRKALKDQSFIIDPLPEEDQIDTSSIDLRIGEPIWVWDPKLSRQKDRVTIDTENFDFKKFSERYLIQIPPEPSGKYSIRPQTFYLAPTFEKVKFPINSRLAGRVEGKSSLARLGLGVHITAPTIHCGTGFGIITLEIFNHGPFSIDVTPGVTRICQLILEQVASEPEERDSRTFKGQKNPKG